MGRVLQVVGMDPSLRNWGISKGTLNLDTRKVHIQEVNVICPVLPTGKQVRQNSLDLESAKQLADSALRAVKGAQAIFVEVPVGSQSARAMASYGICVGVLGALRASGIPFFEVTPTEVKVTAVGSKTASKEAMINWARHSHPEADWPKAAAKAEHTADATAAIHAGLRTNEFKQLIQFF
jgi:Holliday junction resolvasome RuvABC endonuclease subunit